MITSPLIPPSVAEIIVKCWDVNPENRPIAKEVYFMLEELKEMYDNKCTRKSTKRAKLKHFKESEKYIKEMAKYEVITSTRIHPGSVYKSRVLTLQIIEETKG
ncbi:hypothetical protein G9A89_008259 [Geosiphon pyriformis]|nr:hypothetical protein G9A89_008259 [Geosiphon pyriformis]